MKRWGPHNDSPWFWLVLILVLVLAIIILGFAFVGTAAQGAARV